MLQDIQKSRIYTDRKWTNVNGVNHTISSTTELFDIAITFILTHYCAYMSILSANLLTHIQPPP